MMLTSPRIIAIDDEGDHLVGLANSLNRHGVRCFQIPFTEDLTSIQPCPDARVIFADLHLGGGALAADHMTDFSTIGRLLEDTIKPSHPCLILLWTMYPDQAPLLRRFLEERLHGVTKPSDVLPLDKAKHLGPDGNVRDDTALVREIVCITEARPEIVALFDPERHISEVTESRIEAVEHYRPTPEGVTERLTRLFGTPDGLYDGPVPPGFPARETTMDDWLDGELPDFGQTPRQMLNSGDEGVLFLLDRFVNAIATSRALSHPHVVRDIVRHRMEALFRETQDPGSVMRELQHALPDDVSGYVVHEDLSEQWMDVPNPMFGNVAPRQFFEDENVDAEQVLEISSLLDSIDGGVFS